MRIRKLTLISALHYVRLFYRSALFVLLLIGYASYRLNAGSELTERLERQPMILTVTWAVFVVEMILRFFPSRARRASLSQRFSSCRISSTELLSRRLSSVMCTCDH